MQIMLHPANFPSTPYTSVCAHFTQRREARWRFQIRVTCATTTGARFCFMVVNDPAWNQNQMTKEMATNLVTNRRGLEVTVTSTSTTTKQFTVVGATRLLSNAPPAENNALGYSGGMLVGYLLDPPIGITGPNVLNWQLSAQVDLELFNPASGFVDFASGASRDLPVHHASFQIVVGDTGAEIPDTWRNSHPASSWLDGGIYLKFPYPRPEMEGSANGVGLTGTVLVFAIYSCSAPATNWQNDYQQDEQPKYFVTHHEPAAGNLMLVGFNDIHTARNQAGGHVGLIHHGQECCLQYNWPTDTEKKKWSRYFAFGPANLMIRLPGTNATQSGILAFTLIEQTTRSYPFYPEVTRGVELTSRAVEEYLEVDPEEPEDFQMDQEERSSPVGLMSRGAGTSHRPVDQDEAGSVTSCPPWTQLFNCSSSSQPELETSRDTHNLTVIDSLGLTSPCNQLPRTLPPDQHWFCSNSHPSSVSCGECRRLHLLDLLNRLPSSLQETRL